MSAEIEVNQGQSPLVLAFPHTGLDLPAQTGQGLSAVGKTLSDTDFHVDRLYSGLVDDVTTVRTKVHRYVIDANRPPDGGSLYPGQNTTGLIPLTSFDGEPLYKAGREPDVAEQDRRRALYHAPYHGRLQQELDRVRAQHGFAILYDCHSIRSRIPFLFEGILPDMNIGTNDGRSCAPALAEAVTRVCAEQTRYSWVLNGRFKGGWTTRHYGAPDNGVHAIQMELAQAAYLASEHAPFAYDPNRAENLREVLRSILTVLLDWRPQ